MRVNASFHLFFRHAMCRAKGAGAVEGAGVGVGVDGEGEAGERAGKLVGVG